MPSQGRMKNYIKGAYYHIYNRGVNKQEIFYEEEDYSRFLYKLEKYVTGTDPSTKNHKHNINLLCFCLMPNHFHLLVQNGSYRGIEKFMRSLCTSHSMYINRKYGRVGHLFQERYKAKMIKTDEHLMTTGLYIHSNPKDGPELLESYPYSSLKYYTFDKGPSWIFTQPILSYLSLDKQKAVVEYKKLLGQTEYEPRINSYKSLLLK